MSETILRKKIINSLSNTIYPQTDEESVLCNNGTISLKDKLEDLDDSLENLDDRLNKIPSGYYYGQFENVASLPDVSTLESKGYAYVASTDPAVYYIYLFDGTGSNWENSGNKFVTTKLETNLSTKSQTKAPTTKAVADGIETVNLLDAKSLTVTQKYNASANINNRPADVAPVTGVVNSLGYKVLNPALSFAELVENTQSVDNSNTVFEIRDEFNLSGASIIIPANCTLKFNGGAVNNGTVNFNGCVIEGNALMKDIEPIGMVGNDKIQPQIFGAKGDGVADDTKAIRNALRVCNYVHIPNGRYGITQYPARGYLGSNQVGSGKPLENAITIIRDNVTLHLDDDAEIFVKEIVEESETLEGNGFICSIYVLGSRTISEGVVTGYETVKNVTIEGGRFVGNRSMFTAEDYEEHSRENYAGIACSWTEGLTIRNTKITDNSGDALYCVPTWNTVVENIETARNRRCSIGIGCTDGFIVRKCYFHDEKQEYTYQNGNTSTGINNNGIIVLEPEPSVYVPTVENGTERNVLIEDNVYDAKKWTLFFKGNGINLKILRNRIINITNPFLAKGVISLSKAGNPAAAEKTISRYLYIEDNIFEASNLLDYYENTNSSWKDYTFYKLENGKYILLTSKPSDWTTNYEDYYIRQTNFLLNTNSKWDTSKYYEKLGDKKYKLLSTEPSNWSTDYNTYYTKSTNICPAITVTSDEDIHIIGNTFKGLGMCSFYTVSGDVFIKNNFCDWSISLHFSIFNALNANYFITDNDVSCNALLFCSLSSSTKTNSNVVVQNNSISMLSSIFEEGTVFGASMPVATYSIIGNYVENNTIGVFPSPNSPNTLNIIGNTVIAKTTRTAAFNPFGNSNSKRVWNGRLENNIFNFPKSVALVESAAGSTAKLVYKNNIFTDNNNDGNIIPSTSTNVYSDGNLALMVNPKRKTGSSSERPTLTATDVGFPYYDTTLNMPIYWNGSSWVDVNGETIDLQVSDTSVLIGAAADSSKTVSVYYGGSTAPTITVLNSDDSANTWLTATYTLYAPTFVANTYYSAANTQVTTKPSNWETNYMDYFTDAEATIPVAGVPKNEVVFTAAANSTSAPRGAKVLVTLDNELVIINVVQSY